MKIYVTTIYSAIIFCHLSSSGYTLKEESAVIERTQSDFDTPTYSEGEKTLHI